MKSRLSEILPEAGGFSLLDRRFASFLQELSGSSDLTIGMTAGLISRTTREGHICIDLKALTGSPDTVQESSGGYSALPPLEKWLEILKSSPVVGRPGQFRPLILDGSGRLYLYRYWDYEASCVRQLKNRIKPLSDVDESRLSDGLKRFFPDRPGVSDPWQKVAAVSALTHSLCVITGGPGTGKTYTVAGILGLLLEQAAPNSLAIGLAAPTGKAAARLQDAIRQARPLLNCSEKIRSSIPETASTLHRLLGPRRLSPYFQYNRTHPLPLDAVVVDEASMVDLALLAKLLDAMPSHARLILLGDRDQLASVEAGAVLGDICHTARVNSFTSSFCGRLLRLTGITLNPSSTKDDSAGMQDCIVELHHSYRFGEESGIGKAAREVNAGNPDAAFEILTSARYPDCLWKTLPSADRVPGRLGELGETYLKGLFDEKDAEKLFKKLDAFRLLCALRVGPYGVRSVNAGLEKSLLERSGLRVRGPWYHGRPVMITVNDYNLNLYNGDIGVVLEEPPEGPRVWLPAPDGALRRISPSRLPAHETVYAMSVHKSQGSEFDQVLLILPDRDSPVLTRELIYTALTRARDKVTVWGTRPVFLKAAARHIRRTTGLREQLWGDGKNT